MRPFGAVFWAILLILGGALLLLKHVLRWNVNVFGIIFGVFLLLLGICIITGWNKRANDDIFMGGGVQSVADEASYVFSNVTVDLDNAQQEVEINSIFSNVRVNVGNHRVKIKGSGAFCSIRMPDGGTVTFGERTYYGDGEGPEIEIEANCVFGSIVFD